MHRFFGVGVLALLARHVQEAQMVREQALQSARFANGLEHALEFLLREFYGMGYGNIEE